MQLRSLKKPAPLGVWGLGMEYRGVDVGAGGGRCEDGLVSRVCAGCITAVYAALRRTAYRTGFMGYIYVCIYIYVYMYIYIKYINIDR